MNVNSIRTHRKPTRYDRMCVRAGQYLPRHVTANSVAVVAIAAAFGLFTGWWLGVVQ